MNKKRAERA